MRVKTAVLMFFVVGLLFAPQALANTGSFLSLDQTPLYGPPGSTLTFMGSIGNHSGYAFNATSFWYGSNSLPGSGLPSDYTLPGGAKYVGPTVNDGNEYYHVALFEITWKDAPVGFWQEGQFNWSVKSADLSHPTDSVSWKAGVSSAVPEPATMLLLGLGLVGLAGVRKRMND